MEKLHVRNEAGGDRGWWKMPALCGQDLAPRVFVEFERGAYRRINIPGNPDSGKVVRIGCICKACYRQSLDQRRAQ